MADKELESKVLSEIELDHKSLQDGVKHLIEWISKEPHLPNITDDALLKSFIVGSKSVERSKKKLDRYFTARTKYPDAYSVQSRDCRLLQYNQVEKMFFLPGLTPEGYNVIVMEVPLTKEESEAFTVLETSKMFFMMLDSHFRSQPITSGQIVVVNFKGITMDFAKKFITSYTTSIFNIYQNVVPIRMKSMICFNVSSIADLFLNKVLKVILNEKLAKRIIVHSEDHSVLSKYLPSEMIPSDLGGTGPSQQVLWDKSKEMVEKDRDWLMGEGSVGADLSKRPKGRDDDDQVQGTFRKLEID